ncbi:MAG TPA: ATP-binding protein [Kofleriaceae bacterium]|nr:ATP-binding protein [Kofleriaceae bacterium]
MTPDDSAAELREKKRVLAALVVHDLRGPLAAAVGYISLLRDELGEVTPAARSYLDDTELLLGKALGLVSTILDVDELEDGMLRAQLAPVRLVELIERARAGNRAHFEVRQLRCDVDVDPELVVMLDRDLFGRVIENMLDNATRYAPRGGRCGISAKRSDSAVEIAIGNSGPPVPVADREQIFGRYFQVERRRASARANRGLGLYFCKLAVEAHGGTIHVEERGDLGAVFVARLPEQAVT